MAATMLSQAAMAQSAPPAAPVEPQQPGIGVEEIVVTAQRREERLQDVPIAITAITSTRLAATGVATAQDLSVVTPALTTGAQNNYFQPRLRGVGTGAFGPGIENPIATYIDGVLNRAGFVGGSNS
ncbi:TonB-dependent receptor plug domain-containing protein [Sphingobium sp. DC-2]|uniref:TonB-dependent receptor plug domain-containing protein n=1 Tax=Sphingobium sp. DC-2 TaxID=1303256 RepID=UPI0004C2CE44|nr:TonB-dependent receptor plug domain-containing protein [Sphingobium sp. DC-2]